MLLALGAIWGLSFLLLKVALRDLPPTSVIAFRIGLGFVTLALALPFVPESRRALVELRSRWRALALVGATNTAIPFFLLTWGQQYIDTGVAAILNASAPIWTAVFAVAFARSERVSGLRLVGILVGFAGIVLLIGLEPTGGDRAVIGSLAVVAAAALYAASALLTARHLAEVSPVGIALGVLAWGSLFTVPLGLARLPGHDVTWQAGASVVALGVAATGVAYLLYFGLIVGAGPSRAILVTYLVPSFAMVFGVVFLDEALTVQGLAGLALVLLGVAFGTGTLRRIAPAALRSSGRASSLRG
jgi:drug/metabolite transporter (DMT)-like permease